MVDFEAFRSELEASLQRADRSRGGHPPDDAVLMFRIWRCRRSTRCPTARQRASCPAGWASCASQGWVCTVDGTAVNGPDAKTIWLFREQLTRAGALARLFARLDASLAARGCLAMGGQIVDATIAEARSPAEHGGEGDAARRWHAGGLVKVRIRQIDRDGRWTIRCGRKAKPPGSAARQAGAEIAVPMFGTKNHVNIDRRTVSSAASR